MPLSAQRRFQSDRIGEFRESVIREMTREALKHGPRQQVEAGQRG